MAKLVRKGLSSRKPPEPTASHEDIAAWLESARPDLQPIVRHLDRLFRDTLPGLHYAIKWNKAYYGLPDLGWVIELVAYNISVNVVFLGGEDFDPPPPLGSTDRSRYIKISKIEEAQSPEVRSWVEQAGKVPGWI